MCNQLIFNTGAEANHWEKEHLFSEWCQNNQISVMKRKNEHTPQPHTKYKNLYKIDNTSKWERQNN